MTTHDIEQRSEDWLLIRAGRCTGSRVADVMAKTKSGYSTSRTNYAAELVVERLTGKPVERFQSKAMAFGTEMEPEARACYGLLHGVEVQEVGFVEHPTIQMFGCSPDGLVGADGMVEFKVPNPATHLQTLLNDTMDGRYTTQVQAQMSCTGRQYCDLVSYCPDLPGDMALWVRRIPRDEAVIRELEADVSKFLDEVSTTVSKLTEKYALKEAA